MQINNRRIKELLAIRQIRQWVMFVAIGLLLASSQVHALALKNRLWANVFLIDLAALILALIGMVYVIAKLRAGKDEVAAYVKAKLESNTLSRARARELAAAVKVLRLSSWLPTIFVLASLLVIFVVRVATYESAGTLFRRGEQAWDKGLHHQALAEYSRATRYYRIANPLVLAPSWVYSRTPSGKIVAQEYSGLLARTGHMWANSGYFPRAVNSLRKALDAAVASDSPSHLAYAHYEYAQLFLDLDPDTAESHVSSALEALKIDGEFVDDPSLHLLLAELAIARQDFAGALARIHEAEQAASDSDPLILAKKAEALLLHGNLEEAAAVLETLEVVLNSNVAPLRSELFKRVYGEKKDTAHYLYSRVRADIALKTQRYEGASDFVVGYKKLMHPRMVSLAEFVEWGSRTGWYLEGLGRTEEAITAYLRCVRRLEEERSLVPEGMRMRFLFREIYSVPYRHLATMLAALPPNELVAEELRPYGSTNLEVALYFAESTKARTFMELMAATGRVMAGRIPEHVREKEKALKLDLRNGLEAVQRAIMQGGFSPGRFVADNADTLQISIVLPQAPGPFLEAVQSYEELQERWRAFENRLYVESPRYAALNYPRPVPLSTIPVRGDEALVEYALGERASHAFVLEAGVPPRIVRIDATMEEITDLVSHYLEPLRSGRTRPAQQLGRQLARHLLSGVLAKIDTKKRVILIPDGVLGSLPFEMLPWLDGTAGSEEALLGDKWAISYAPSLSVLTLNRIVPVDQPSKPFFGLADPVLKTGKKLRETDSEVMALRGIHIQRARYVFPPLPEARTEVTEAARVYHVSAAPPDVLVGESAAETRFKATNLAGYKVLHLATHGVANSDLAGIGEPALMLASDDRNDGVLRASEVANLALGSSLVVLAACKTGLGEEVGGEGVMSMARAFQHAGARTVVMSLWNIPSEVTLSLFREFYRNLSTGKTVGQSLRLAKKAIRGQYPEPFYWAGFVLVGEETLALGEATQPDLREAA